MTTSIKRRMPLLGAVALAVSAPADAAWEFVPELVLEADSNDNPRLLTDEQLAILDLEDDAAARLRADLRLPMIAYSPRSEFVIEPALRSDNYFADENQELESNDVFLRTSAERRWQSTSAGFEADFAREKLVGNEFLDVGPDDIDADDPVLTDTVLVGLNERRRRAILAPYTEFSLSERGALRLDARAIDVSYDADAVTGRTDFTDVGFGIEMLRELSRRGTLSGRVFGSRFEADANANETDTAGVELRYTRQLSNIWSVNTAVGLERNEFSFVDDTGLTTTGTDDNVTFSAGFRRRVERASLNLDLRRSVNPDSFGFLTARNELRAVVLRQMSPTIEGSFGLRYIDTDSLGTELDSDRRYGRLELGLDWSFTELWSLVVGYEFQQRRIDGIDGAGGDADSNMVSVGVRYAARSRR